MTPRISIIIPVYNEANHIRLCLESLLEQSLKPQEIIIVDDGSTDNTRAVLSKLKTKSSKLKIIYQQHQGAGSARNLGVKHASGNILVFVDADMEFDPDFLKNLVAPIRLGRTRGTFSKDEYVKNWSNPWAKAWSFCLGLKDHRLIPANYPLTSPVFRAILRSEFDQVGGFDTSRGYDDDWTLSEKLAYQATLAPKAVYFHSNPSSLLEIFHQARWQATRKYKLGPLGQILNLIKTSWRIFSVRSLHQLIALQAYLFGLQVGFIEKLFTRKVSQ